MSEVLDRDIGAIAAARLKGRLKAATLTRTPSTGAYDINNPARGMIKSAPVSYSCDAIAFSYKQAPVDGSTVYKGDYRVVIVRNSLVDASGGLITPQPDDKILVPPPGSETPASATIIEIEGITEAQVTVRVRGAPV